MTIWKHSLAGLALVAALAIPSAGRAQDSRFSGVAQIDFTNAYIFRGIMQEKSGIIVQPWGEVYASLYSSDDGFIRDFTAGVGFWLSIHSAETLATNSPTSVYEADYYPLLSVDFAGGLNLLTTYYWYDSPNGAWDEAVQELNLKFSLSEGPFERIAPWVNFAIETHSTSLGSDSGSGVQFGIAPTFFENDMFSLTGSAEAGFSFEDYYEGIGPDEEKFGYANLGIGVGVPITDFLSASLGFKYFFFGDDLQVVNNGHGGHGVVVGSLSASF